MHIGTIDFYHLYKYQFHWPLLWLGSQDQLKAKPVWFIIFLTSPLIMMKFNVVLKQFKLNILTLLLSEIYGTKEITAVPLTVKTM